MTVYEQTLTNSSNFSNFKFLKFHSSTTTKTVKSLLKIMTKKTYPTEVRSIPIKLGQFLKFANIAQDGIEAKMLIQNGNIKVNGKVETRRGKQLQNSDAISYENSTWIITSELNTR